MKRESFRGALEAVDRVLNRGGDADDVLREVVAVVQARVPHYAWVAVSFTEAGELQLGPQAGARPNAGAELSWPIAYEGRRVGELDVFTTDQADDEDRAFLARVATLVSPYCLVGWDTGGRPWDP